MSRLNAIVLLCFFLFLWGIICFGPNHGLLNFVLGIVAIPGMVFSWVVVFRAFDGRYR